MEIIIIICAFIFFGVAIFKNKYKFFITGLSILIFGSVLIFIIDGVNNLPFIPREVLIKYDTIAPIIRNDLNDNEILYSYNDDEYCYYYIESSEKIKGELIFDEIKIPLYKVKFELDDNEYPIVKVKYSEFTSIWKFIIGRSKPIIIECIINK
jgi:hypothetical protein